MPAKGWKMSRATKNKISKSMRKLHAKIRRNNKRFGPVRAGITSPKMYRIPNNKVVNVAEHTPIEAEELEAYTPPIQNNYEELLERFKLLQLELAERDVIIARLHLELSEVKRDTIKRINAR